MNNLKELIIKKKELEDIFENLKKENLDCIKKTYLKQNELYNTKQKYFEILNKKNKLKNKKQNILVFTLLSLLLIVITLILSIVLSGILLNTINIVLFKSIINMTILAETILSISIISSKFLKYNYLKDSVNRNFSNIKINLEKKAIELEFLNKKHIEYCKLLKEIEAKKDITNKEICENLFMEKSVIRKSHNLIKNHKNIERVRKF